MAYGSYAGLEGLTSGFKPSDDASDALGGIAKDKYGIQGTIASDSLRSLAQMRAQKYTADKQLEAAQIQADAMNSPQQIIGGIVGDVLGGFAGGFGGGVGAAAGKKWFA
jgi:hypothetical protein